MHLTQLFARVSAMLATNTVGALLWALLISPFVALPYKLMTMSAAFDESLVSAL
jgi:hypothetical protein